MNRNRNYEVSFTYGVHEFDIKRGREGERRNPPPPFGLAIWELTITYIIERLCSFIYYISYDICNIVIPFLFLLDIGVILYQVIVFDTRSVCAKFVLSVRFKVGFKGPLSGVRQFLTTEGPLEIMKNAFYFTLKAFSLYFNFFLDFLVM